MSTNTIHITNNSTIINVYEQLAIFAPCSAGSYQDLANQTIQSANQCFPFLAKFVEAIKGKIISEINFEAFHKNVPTTLASNKERLKELLDYYGSDKANSHDYHELYSHIFSNKKVCSLLEIGLGTNNEDVVSNMGHYGKPGASLRAFRDYLPDADIYGADIDHRILFEETRIKTFFVDQTNPDSFSALDRELPNNIDLIIDDGLHSPNANLNVLTFGIKKLSVGGWLVIEDIHAHSLPVWHVTAALIPQNYEAYLIKTKLAYAFVVNRK